MVSYNPGGVRLVSDFAGPEDMLISKVYCIYAIRSTVMPSLNAIAKYCRRLQV